MSPAWEHVAWRSVPVVLVLAWFVLLIGGYSLGGLVHLLLIGAAVVFGFQVVGDSPG